jgi:hypothetical protein
MQNPLEVKPEEIKKEEVLPEKQSEVVGIPADGELEKLALARSLGLENIQDISKYDDQLSNLLEWAKTKGATSREDMVWQVRELSNMIGGPRVGTPMIRHLSQYAYLEMEKIKIDNQLKTYAK